MALESAIGAGATGTREQGFLPELMIFAGVMNGDIRKHNGPPFKWGEGWKKANPVDLLQKLIQNLNEAQTANTALAWAKVANYCMMLASLETEQKTRLANAAKLIVVQVTPAEAEAAGPLLQELSQRWAKEADQDKASARNILVRLFNAVRPLFVARTDPKGPGGQ